jgi:hypothetical protein
MKIILKSFIMTIASLVMLSVITQAQATSSTVVLNLEGNPTCDSLGDNASILAARDNGPQVGVNEISGPRIDGLTQTIQYTIDTSGEFPLLSWEILNQDEFVNPINYVIIKAQGNNGARVFHFGGIGGGEVSDIEEEATGNIAAVSFCYGLTEGPIGAPLAGIPDCGDLDIANNLGGTLIGACPTDSSGNTDPSQKRLLISMDLDADNFDLQSCTCNVPGGLPSCDPDVPVDEPGACIVTDPNDILEGVNERVPVMIQGVETPNSYICYTIGGDRFCYGDF